jgi:5-methylcytosine-specific restriction endonuclease McrA
LCGRMSFKHRVGSSTARGYGADWQRVRRAVLAIEPLCRFCADVGRTEPATDLDHIRPFDGLADPLRLDADNLRPLCRPCHMQRTARQASGKPEMGGCDASGMPLDPGHAWRAG